MFSISNARIALCHGSTSLQTKLAIKDPETFGPRIKTILENKLIKVLQDHENLKLSSTSVYKGKKLAEKVIKNLDSQESVSKAIRAASLEKRFNPTLEVLTDNAKSAQSHTSGENKSKIDSKTKLSEAIRKIRNYRNNKDASMDKKMVEFEKRFITPVK